ncbi:MAG: hypothetical protein HC836_12640 [Richelia sp. RM2_1_2]|nr:hypothetical protein [Richelia sp. RM2_1_2]
MSRENLISIKQLRLDELSGVFPNQNQFTELSGQVITQVTNQFYNFYSTGITGAVSKINDLEGFINLTGKGNIFLIKSGNNIIISGNDISGADLGFNDFVTGLNGITGDVQIQGFGDIFVTKNSNIILISGSGASNYNYINGVTGVNGETGAINLYGAGNIFITNNNGDFTISGSGNGIANNYNIGVTGLNQKTGAIFIQSAGDISILESGNILTISGSSTDYINGVTGINGETGDINLLGAGNVFIINSGTNFTISGTSNNITNNYNIGVTGLNQKTGEISIQGAGNVSILENGNTLTISGSGQATDISLTGAGNVFVTNANGEFTISGSGANITNINNTYVNGVTGINGISGGVEIIGAGNVSITNNNNQFIISGSEGITNIGGVTGINGQTGAINLIGAGNVFVTNTNGELTISGNAGSGGNINIEGTGDIVVTQNGDNYIISGDLTNQFQPFESKAFDYFRIQHTGIGSPGNDGASTNSWTNKSFNYIDRNDNLIITGHTGSGIFTITQSGDYELFARGHFYKCGRTQFRLFNVSQDKVVNYGTVGYTAPANAVSHSISINSVFNTTGNEQFKYQFIIQDAGEAARVIGLEAAISNITQNIYFDVIGKKINKGFATDPIELIYPFDYISLSDTGIGDFTANIWNQRKITNIQQDDTNLVSLTSSGTFYLPSGFYEVDIMAVIRRTAANKLRLFNLDHNIALLHGITQQNDTTFDANDINRLIGTINLSGNNNHLIIEHYPDTKGSGSLGNFGNSTPDSGQDFFVQAQFKRIKKIPQPKVIFTSLNNTVGALTLTGISGTVVEKEGSTFKISSDPSQNLRDVVFQTGNQIISGQKTFSDDIDFSNGLEILNSKSINFENTGSLKFGANKHSLRVSELNGEPQLLVNEKVLPTGITIYNQTGTITNNITNGVISLNNISGEIEITGKNGVSVLRNGQQIEISAPVINLSFFDTYLVTGEVISAMIASSNFTITGYQIKALTTGALVGTTGLFTQRDSSLNVVNSFEFYLPVGNIENIDNSLNNSVTSFNSLEYEYTSVSSGVRNVILSIFGRID